MLQLAQHITQYVQTYESVLMESKYEQDEEEKGAKHRTIDSSILHNMQSYYIKSTFPLLGHDSVIYLLVFCVSNCFLKFFDNIAKLYLAMIQTFWVCEIESKINVYTCSIGIGIEEELLI